MVAIGDTVRVRGFSGVACRVIGLEQVWDPCLALCEDEDGNTYEEDTGDGEWIDGDGSRVFVRMVGDDHKYLVDIDDCTPIDEEEFCSCCGQIGCAWG